MNNWPVLAMENAEQLAEYARQNIILTQYGYLPLEVNTLLKNITEEADLWWGEFLR